MTAVRSRGLVIVGIAFTIGALQWQTLVVPGVRSLLLHHRRGRDRRRMTSVTTPASTNTCSQNPHPSRNDICSLLPVDATASFVWNQGLVDDRNQLLVTGNKNNQRDDDNHDPSKVLNLLNAYRLLRGVRNVPSHKSWKRIFENHHHQSQDRPLQVWVFANPWDVQRSSDCRKGQACDPTWIQLLNETAAQNCHMLDHIEYTILDWTFATTEFYTRLLTAQRDKAQGPGMIIHALSRHDLRHANMEHIDPHSVLWEEERRRILQDFVRAGRRSNPCHDTVILFVDDFIPTTTATATQQSSSSSSVSLWVEQVNSRMLQQISEHYGTGLISFSQVVMELILGVQKTEYLALMAPDESGQFKPTAHKALTQSILYGLLHYAVTYCNTKDRTTTSDATVAVESLIPLDIANRVKGTVLPPFLDAEQTLLTVSGEWSLQEDTERQFHERHCSNQGTQVPSFCMATYYVGQPLSTLGNGESPNGWTLSPEGMLRFTKSAQLKWSLGESDDAKVGLEGGRITVFLLLQNTEEIQLTWTITSQALSTTGNFSSSSKRIRSPSNGTIAAQMVVPLPDRIEDDLSFYLECSDTGSVVEIVGFFLCPEETIKRIITS